MEILRYDTCDINLNLQLKERLLVSVDGGVSSIETLPKPDVTEEMWTVQYAEINWGGGWLAVLLANLEPAARNWMMLQMAHDMRCVQQKKSGCCVTRMVVHTSYDG